jgi:hypothetical protein
MKIACRHLIFWILFLSPLLLSYAGDELSRPRVYYPRPLELWEWQKSVGLVVTTLPQEIVEEEINQSPAIDFHSRVGLPWGFSADGRIVTQVLTTQLSVGPKWSHDIGRFAFSVGYDVAWWFGFMTIEGFDNKANGWLNYPNLTVGWDFDDFYLSARAEALIVLSFLSYAGENRMNIDRNALGGLSLQFTIEQPFWKSTHVTLGFKASYLRFFYQSWFTFETFNRFFFIPELSIGFLL